MITLCDAYKTYGRGEGAVHALSGVNLSVKQGEMSAIMGKSGSGKSTLLNIIGGIDSLTSGTYAYDDVPVQTNNQKVLSSFRQKHIGFILQYFALIEEQTVYQNIALPLKYRRFSKQEIRSRVEAVSLQLGIGDKLDRYPGTLSGGQRQRVAIARAIIHEPQLLLADEPTGALDEKTEKSIMELFVELNRAGQTILIVTHDSKVAQMCGKIYQLSDGVIV